MKNNIFRCDKDNLDSCLRKLFNKEFSNKYENKNNGLWISMKLLHGDIKQVKTKLVILM